MENREIISTLHQNLLCTTMKENFESANQYYSHFNFSDIFFNFQDEFILTDGIFEVAGHEGCFWFLKMIVDNHPYLKSNALQTWELKRLQGNEFKIETINRDNEVIFEFTVVNNDFRFDNLIVLIKDKIIMLPSEYHSATRSPLILTASAFYLKFRLLDQDNPDKIQ